jgi:hypothetical protein
MNASNVRKHLDLSTAHITEEDNALLMGDAAVEKNVDGYDQPEQPSIPCVEYGYGFIVFVNHHHDDAAEQAAYVAALVNAGYSSAFCNLIKLAWKLDVDMIRLDRDADEDDELPTFQW